MSMHDPRSRAGDGMPGGEELERMFDAHVDGALEGADRARFEAMLASNAALRAEFERAKAIEASMRRCYAPPITIDLPVPDSPGKIGPRRPTARPRWLPLGMGIAAVLAIVCGIQLAPMIRDWQSAPRVVRGDAAVCYKAIEAAGYKPDWVCKDDAELAKYTREHFGQSWKIEPAEGLTLVGWTYTGKLFKERYANVLLAEYQGKRVVLVVDEKRAKRTVATPADRSLFAHHKCFGGVTVYEISPFPDPVIIGRIKTAD